MKDCGSEFTTECFWRMFPCIIILILKALHGRVCLRFFHAQSQSFMFVMLPGGIS